MTAMKGEKNAKYITYNGKTQTMSAWAKECGMLLQTFTHRYRAWNGDMDRIMNTPLREATRYYVGGKHRTVREMAELNGNVCPDTMWRWLAHGISPEEAVTKKKRRASWGKNEGKQGLKPTGCTHPDCDNCPYDDCKW